MKLVVYFLICSLGVAPGLAAATESGKEVYQGISARLVCHLDQQRPIARIELGEHLDFDLRQIIFFDERGRPFRSAAANCDYEEADYVCRWGKTHVLKIKMSRVEASVPNRLVPSKMLRGWMDSDIFRPGTGLSCPLTKTPKT